MKTLLRANLVYVRQICNLRAHIHLLKSVYEMTE